MRLIDADALQYSDARDMLPTGQYITREEIDKAAEQLKRTTKRTKEPRKEPKEQLKEPKEQLKAAKQPSGHWEPYTTEQGRTLGVYCSECKQFLLMNPTPYCPNCGAKMGEVKDND